MIEEIIIRYLNKNLNVPTYAEMPEDKQGSFILIEKAGSSRNNYINSATIVLQSYAKSMNEAARLNEEVKSAMDDIIIHEQISKSKLNSDYNYMDTERKQYRYQAVYEVFY